MTNFMIDDEQAVGLAARRAELFLVHLAEELALIEFDGALEIAAERQPGNTKHLHFDPARRIEPGDKPGKTAPAALEEAQAAVVENRIELGANQRIKSRDVTIERAAAVFRMGGEAQRRAGPEAVGRGRGRRQKVE